jgi:predicted transcriptional regulator
MLPAGYRDVVRFDVLCRQEQGNDMKRRLSVLIGGASNTTDYADVLKKAEHGGTMDWGSRMKALNPGDPVLIYIARPHSKLVAEAKVLRGPKKGKPDDYAYRVKVGAIRLLPSRVTLDNLRRKFKSWNWLRQPRAAVAVPQEYAEELWKLVHNKRSHTQILISNADKGLRAINEQASTGRSRFWLVPKYTAAGDTVFFYVTTPKQAIVAKGKALSPVRATNRKWFEAKIGEVQMLDKPVKLAELRKMFPKWNWLRSVTMFGYMTPEQSKRLLTRCTVKSDDESLNQQSESQLCDAMDKLCASDKQREVLQRTEQSLLRERIFGKVSTGECGICGREFPVNLLIAAHIKPRSRCTSKERNDYRNNVIPMCKFGCDDLFEKGYVTVRKGKVTTPYRPSGLKTTTVNKYLKAIAGLPCKHWQLTSIPYFNWHNEHTPRK